MLGSRLREQLESDSEPEDDPDLYLDAGKGEKKEKSEPDKADKGPALEKEGLDEEDLFAQEKATLHFDGDIKVCGTGGRDTTFRCLSFVRR